MHTKSTFMQLLSVIRAHNKRETGTIEGKQNACSVDVSLSDMLSSCVGNQSQLISGVQAHTVYVHKLSSEASTTLSVSLN